MYHVPPALDQALGTPGHTWRRWLIVCVAGTLAAFVVMIVVLVVLALLMGGNLSSPSEKALFGGVFGATFGAGLGLVQWAAFLRTFGITRLWIVFSAVGGMAAALLDWYLKRRHVIVDEDGFVQALPSVVLFVLAIARCQCLAVVPQMRTGLKLTLLGVLPLGLTLTAIVALVGSWGF